MDTGYERGSGRAVVAVHRDDDERKSLSRILTRSGWRVVEAFTKVAALAALRADTSDIGVVICESGLADGNWEDLLNEMAELPAPPSLIVTSRMADNELWGRVLGSGGYDLLATPFEAEEVLRVAGAAWRYRRNARKPQLSEGPEPKAVAAGAGR